MEILGFTKLNLKDTLYVCVLGDFPFDLHFCTSSSISLVQTFTHFFLLIVNL